MNTKKIELIQALDDFYQEIWYGYGGNDVLYGVQKFPDFEQEFYSNDIWAYGEITNRITKTKETNLIADLEEYLISVGDYQEMYQITHSVLEINPFDTLMEMLSQFLDFLYNIHWFQRFK